MARLLRSLPWDFLFIVLVWLLWMVGMQMGDRWLLFAENYFMSITMAFGSFIAGSTSQGGGAVAFPVMTLAFRIPPPEARDFSLMIQSVGMTSASVAILIRRISIDHRAIAIALPAGCLGVLASLLFDQPLLAADQSKLFFVSLWLAFGCALFAINRPGRSFRKMSLSDGARLNRRQIATLSLVAALGGFVSGQVGNGIDVLVFSLLVLGFRVCEKVATPTSVILMAAISLAGFLFRSLGFGGEAIAASTWGYWWVAVPVVAIGAPLGARLAARWERRSLVGLLLCLIAVQFLTAIVIVPLTGQHILLIALTFGLGLALFFLVGRWGARSARRPLKN